MKYPRLLAALAGVALTGCAGSEAASPQAAPEISRDGAVSTAREDARSRFNLTPSGVVASRSGRFWLIDLRTIDGAQAHYAIAQDGSIRERRLFP